jgi:hypothetical protein
VSSISFAAQHRAIARTGGLHPLAGCGQGLAPGPQPGVVVQCLLHQGLGFPRIPPQDRQVRRHQVGGQLTGVAQGLGQARAGGPLLGLAGALAPQQGLIAGLQLQQGEVRDLSQLVTAACPIDPYEGTRRL